jgi:hypothetical protein
MPKGKPSKKGLKAVLADQPSNPPPSDLITERDALIAEIRQRNAEVVAPTPPAPPTKRQRTQIELEQEAGRKAIERHEAQAANRPVPQKDPHEGSMTPVFRPGDGSGAADTDINKKDPAISPKK